MPAPTLSAADKALLAKADKAHVHAALANLKHLPPGDWLTAQHPYQDGQLPRDEILFSAIPPSNIIESVAVRGPLHCIDGWSFLSRAVASLLCGDYHAARHLAYYAELRAALSILASHGIGNFNRRNLVIDSGGAIVQLPKLATHEFVWAALSAWAELPRSFRSMTEAIKLGGVSLYDATTAFFPSPSNGMLAEQIIQEWGFDLISGSEDRHERNLSSYNPSDLIRMSSSVTTDMDFVRDLWAAFEPDRFYLEKHMLRKILDLQQTIHGPLNGGDQNSGYGKLDPRAQNLASIGFLFHVDQPGDNLLLARAADSTRPAEAESMMARSALLLRLATSLAEENFAQAAVQPLVHLDVWWKAFGAGRGLWTPHNEPVDMADLWYEIEDALNDAGAIPAADRYAWLGSVASNASRLHEAERIALWNICR